MPRGEAGGLLSFVGSFVCLLLTLAPWSQVFFVPPPLLGLIAVSFWAQKLPLYAVFSLGLLHDVLSGAPLGFWAFLYVLTAGLTLIWRPLFAGAPQRAVWGAFILTCFFVFLSAYFLGFLWLRQFPPAGLLVGQLALTVVAYPVVVSVLRFGERAFGRGF